MFYRGSKKVIPIKPLSKEDRDAIERLLNRSTPFNQEEIATSLAVIDAALDHPEKGVSSVYCAHLPHGDLLGFICFGPIPMTDRCYNLYWIVVDKKFTRRGVGGELMLYMEEKLVKKNGRRIYTDTSSAPQYEQARLFFENYGFFVDSVMDDFFRDGEDKIVYRKDT
jgi:ribosomal protein S18 acetylase RimI-like enzyme